MVFRLDSSIVSACVLQRMACARHTAAAPKNAKRLVRIGKNVRAQRDEPVAPAKCRPSTDGTEPTGEVKLLVRSRHRQAATRIPLKHTRSLRDDRDLLRVH